MQRSEATNSISFIACNAIRLLSLLLAVTVISFVLVNAAPIDPVTAYVGPESNISVEQRENIAEFWGFNDSPIERYFTWLGHLFSGDLGISTIYQQPVSQVLLERSVASLALMGTAWVLSGVLGFILGIVSAVFEGRWIDRAIKSFSLLLSSAPTFWLALLALMLFSVTLKWFPLGLAAPAGMLAEDITIWDRLYHLILPALVLSVSGIAGITLHTREKLISVLGSDYVLFAKARGESKRSIVSRHGLRNILLPAITLQFASFSELFGGSVLAEQVFSYPGLGDAIVQAGLSADIPLLLGGTLVAATFVFVGNLIANILYGVVDPRIRQGSEAADG